MHVRSVLAVLTCTGLMWTVACSGGRQKSGEFGAGISAEAIKAHLEFLADDALEGRHTGARGHDVAARYMAAQFAAAGLGGGMPDGGFYQKVPFRRTEVVPGATSLMLSGGGKPVRFDYDTGFLLMDTHLAPKGGFSAPVVFVGYGVSAPELNYDDYADLDVHGKIVAFLAFEAPAKFPAEVRGYYTSHEVKREIAASHGAAGVLLVLTPEVQRKFPWKFMQLALAVGYNSMKRLDPGGRVLGLEERAAPAPILGSAAAEALFGGEKHSLAEVLAAAGKGEPPRLALSKTATVRYESRHTAVESQNVVAVLEGADKTLKDEYVVLSTHIDHLGIGPAVDGDSIYNGALDNASGCAVLLEIARAFSQLPAKPRRSVLFAAVTGEEQGLLGSDHFAANPPVPTEKVVANINLDGAVPYVPSLRDVIVHGSAHSSLGRTADQAAAEAGFEVTPDPAPDEGLFVRTDHFSFVKQGIPAVFLDLGVKSGQPGVDAAKVRRQWFVTLYHSPKDDASQKFDYATGAKFARFAGLVGYRAAMETERPSWNHGDFFGKRFSSGTAK